MRRRRLAPVAAALLLGLGLLAPSALAAQRLNAYALEGQFMCVFCHQPLNQVNDTEADVEKTTLDQLVNRGLTLSQVRSAMVADYGEEVLARPPASGFNLLIYVLPPVVVLLGLGLIAWNLPRWRRRARASALARAGQRGPDLDPLEAARLDEELSRFDA